MAPEPRILRMYGMPSDLPAPPWATVEQRLRDASLYWVVAATADWPHPRPVWGVWHDGLLCLSLGSPVLRRSVESDGRVTVHLESATDVVLVEGWVVRTDAVDSAVRPYQEKYDYAYDVAQYGPLLAVAPVTVLAWTAAGPGGRDGFRAAGAWSFSDLT